MILEENNDSHSDKLEGRQVRMKLSLVAKRPETGDVVSFRFTSDAPLTWHAGQFLSYTLPHPAPDDRGETRYFTIASAPFEGHVMLTTRFAPERSSTSAAFRTAWRGGCAAAGDLAARSSAAPGRWGGRAADGDPAASLMQFLRS